MPPTRACAARAPSPDRCRAIRASAARQRRYALCYARRRRCCCCERVYATLIITIICAREFNDAACIKMLLMPRHAAMRLRTYAAPRCTRGAYCFICYAYAMLQRSERCYIICCSVLLILFTRLLIIAFAAIDYAADYCQSFRLPPLPSRCFTPYCAA